VAHIRLPLANVELTHLFLFIFFYSAYSWRKRW
jgi:hypothetical protein